MGIPKNQQHALDPGFSKLNRLINAGDTERIYSKSSKLFRYNNSSVSVCLCLDRRHKLTARRKHIFQKSHIVFKCLHVKLNPCPVLCIPFALYGNASGTFPAKLIYRHIDKPCREYTHCTYRNKIQQAVADHMRRRRNQFCRCPHNDNNRRMKNVYPR